jgi:N6-adenosine-specific RNA methylase IME4
MSSILYQSADSSLILIDIPRSIELAQGVLNSTKRIISSKPRESPFPSLAPKSVKAKAKARENDVPLEDLFLCKRLEFALQELRHSYQGEWCLSRIYGMGLSQENEQHPGKRKRCDEEVPPSHAEKIPSDLGFIPPLETTGSLFYSNPTSEFTIIRPNYEKSTAIVPPGATLLSGDIAETLPIFLTAARKFDLVVLDPPWPNRSARRVKTYRISYDTPEIHKLLSSIPLENHLNDKGMVAVWITNKPLFREMVTGSGGLFSQWGVQLVEEWTWLKISQSGEPICALNSGWRKPYEILLIGKRGGRHNEVTRRVVVGVPDLHSRKPGLKEVFHGIFQQKNVRCLEIFARNLTAGWWAWGNEVLKFQMEECWIDSSVRPSGGTDIP